MESISGICGLGTHLPQLLRNHVGGVDNIDARLSQIISELEATAKALTTLSQILEEDKRDIKDQILSSRGWKEVDVLVNRSNIAFRDVVVLIAEATGPRAPLIAVEEYVSKAMEIDSEEKELEKAKHTLEIELISAEHLLWHWRLAKFEKHSAELDQIKLRLLLVLAVVDLAKKKKITAEYVPKIIATYSYSQS